MTIITSNTIIFTDSSQQTTAAQSIGIGQTWQDVTASRAAATTYTNSFTKPIMVSIICGSNTSTTSCNARLSIDGSIVQYFNTDPDTTYLYVTLSAIIKPNSAYRIDVSNIPVSSWKELR